MLLRWLENFHRNLPLFGYQQQGFEFLFLLADIEREKRESVLQSLSVMLDWVINSFKPKNLTPN